MRNDAAPRPGREAAGAFHPVVRDWFQASFQGATECQRQAWPAIDAGGSVLIAAPTGSGKTLAAFLCALDDLVRQDRSGTLADQVQVLYVSPLKALGNDIQKNLEQPLAQISARFEDAGEPPLALRTAVRSGDTPARERAAMRRRPPHILVTTPESLYILLTSGGGRNALRGVRTVIVDEIHALVGGKRGAHLALSLARLDALTGTPAVRIGLSATQTPIEDVAAFLVGTDARGAARPCRIVDTGHRRERDLALELPRAPLDTVMSNEVWGELYDRLAELARVHRTTLVFVNTRRLAERVAKALSERLGAELVGAHHGSLSREQRLQAEQRLKDGQLRLLVATASLELGIDIGDVDLVCQLGSTRSIANFVQRVGRAGHGVGRVPKGRLFPLSREELAESAALLDAVARGEMDRLVIPPGALDVLAQQIVAAVACEEWSEPALYDCLRRAWPYRGLALTQFEALTRMLAEGYAARRGRAGAYLHRDLVGGMLRARRGARLTAVTGGGAIPDTAQFEVRQSPADLFVGTLDEDFAVESMAGDIFQLGNTSWRILRVEPGVVRVEDARGQPPTIPFWMGEAPARTDALSAAVSRLRARFDGDCGAPGADPSTAIAAIPGVGAEAATQLAEFLAAGRAPFGALPDSGTILMERFFDESGGMQLVIHSPFGARINRAWGLSLRKRFCRTFNFELQAAATEDALVLSLGQTHSFPLADVWGFLKRASVRDVLVQALLDAPMFNVRWRWNATCALAIPRFRGGKKVPARLQRMFADDFAAVIFPDSRACFENIRGAREIPDHPLVEQTISDCLTEAMDIEGFESLLGRIEAGEVRLIARDLTEPSPLAQAILNARPYAFLDDAPLEERRTQAVIGRRWLDAATAADLGRLDPEAIERVRAQAWPEAAHADELHDALCLLGFVTAHEGARSGWESLFESLMASGRACRLRAPGADPWLWVAVDRLPQILSVLPGAEPHPAIALPTELAAQRWEPDAALAEILRGRLEGMGPVGVAALGAPLALAPSSVAIALARLEGEGSAMRGEFTGAGGQEWCDRRLLARIHRETVERLRREIEPVPAAQYMRFLFEWQHVAPQARLSGAQALAAVLEQLQGWAAPAAAWEEDLLALRIKDYAPAWLDELCLAGRFQWLRAGQRGAPVQGRAIAPVRSTPIVFVPRRARDAWQRPGTDGAIHTAAAQRVLGFVRDHGASFFDDIAEGTGLLRAQVESALGELVAHGAMRCDSFKGLRALIAPAAARSRRRSRFALPEVDDAGRWTLVADRSSPAADAVLEAAAGALLRRWGVLCRAVIEREDAAPPWRELVRVLRRMEARGDIRGGRFVTGLSGEQYALPDAVSALRALNKRAPAGEIVVVSGVDPLNLTGIVTPGPRLAALASHRVLYRDGIALALHGAERTELIAPVPESERWQIHNALLRRAVAPSLEEWRRELAGRTRH
ncbi:MAG: DEAD/DEAH box helicase [Gammaproteobacteria bacterium]